VAVLAEIFSLIEAQTWKKYCRLQDLILNERKINEHGPGDLWPWQCRPYPGVGAPCLPQALPLAFVFGFLWGGRGAYVSHAVSMTITGLVSLYLLRWLMGISDDACAARKGAEQILNPKRTDPS